MKIYSWNVNGIRAVLRKGDLQRFLEAHDPDILCLQETKANKEQVEIDFPQYDEYWYSAEKKGYSGTAIFTKHAPLEVLEGIPEEISSKYALKDDYGDTTKEGRVVTLEFEHFYVSTVYTPNAKDDLSRIPFMIELARRMRSIITQNVVAAVIIALVGLVLAATDNLNIWGAALFHFVGDVFVLANSFRLFRFGEGATTLDAEVADTAAPAPREASMRLNQPVPVGA